MKRFILKTRVLKGFGEKRKEEPNQGSGTWIAAFQAALSKANSLVIFQPFRSLLTTFSLPGQTWSAPTSLRIIVPPYDAAMHWCLWGVFVAHAQTILVGVARAFLQLGLC